MSGLTDTDSNRSNVVEAGLYDEQATVPSWTPTATSGPVGYSSTVANQTGGMESKPEWMTGFWDMDSWGKDASTNAPLSNAELTPFNNASIFESLFGNNAADTGTYAMTERELAKQLGYQTGAWDESMLGGSPWLGARAPQAQPWQSQSQSQSRILSGF